MAYPPKGRAFVTERVVVADEKDEAERVGEVDVAAWVVRCGQLSTAKFVPAMFHVTRRAK